MTAAPDSPGSDPDPLLHHLPRLVRFWDVEAPGRLHQSIMGSMAFVDVSGFTELSERLARHGNVGAEEVTDVIERTFAELLPGAYAHGANLLKFGGDALLLLFDGDGHAARAVAGADAMRTRLRDLGPFTTSDGDVTLRMSAGVHTGAVDVFLVGGDHREFLVTGPAATMTVAMESTAEPGQLVMSPATAAAVPPANHGPEAGDGVLLRGTPPTPERRAFHPARKPPGELGHFVPSALRQALTTGMVEPEHRRATVAFIHVGGVDDLVASAGATRVAEVLDELMRIVQEATRTHGVTVLGSDVATGGIKMILATGVPMATGNDAERMLLALREVVAIDHPLPVRAGVTTGHVFSGVVGATFRRTYTVMGDVVNLAARLMARAPVGEVYTTDDVLAASRTTFATTSPAPFTVKGKAEPITARSVGDPVGSQATGDQTAGGDLVGRDAELAKLLADWTAATADTARFVALRGEVGMGKSQLLRAFLGRAGPDRVVRSECRLYQSATPYFPMRAIVRAACHLEGDDPAAALTALVEERAPHLQPWLALLGEVADLDLPVSSAVAELEDRFRPMRTAEAVHALLQATLDQPTVFLVEDAHWMDDSSRELLAHLAEATTAEPWLFVFTTRPDGDDVEPVWDVEHELPPLSPDDAMRLVVAASANAPLLPHQLEMLVERGEGRPLFLLELLEAVQGGDDADSLPRSVEGLIAARIDRLAMADRTLLRRLAVLGTGFQIEHVRTVLHDDEPAPEADGQGLAHLRDFLDVDETGWTHFHNSLIRDVAYAGLPFRTRLALHAEVGDAIRASAGDDPASQAALLSVHYHRARRWDDSWTFSRLAGDTASRIFANEDAATFYRRALDAARNLDLSNHDRGRVATSLAEVLERAGRYEDALDALRRAMRHLADDDDLRAEVLLRRAQVRMRKATYAQALRDTAIGLRLLEDRTDRAGQALRANLRAVRSSVRMAQQRPAETLQLARAAIEDARAADERAALARASANLDWAHFVLGEPARAVHSEEAVAIYESLGLLDRASDIVNNMGGFAYYQGDWNTAVDCVARSRDLSARAGNAVQAAMTGVNLGELLVAQGRLDEAEPVLRESLRVLTAAGDRDHAVNAELQLARLSLQRGNLAEAQAQLDRVRARANELGQLQFAYEAVLALAECRVRRGDAPSALELVAAATDAAGDQAAMFAPQRARVQAHALDALGRHDEARAVMVEGLAAASDHGLVHEEALLRNDLLDLGRRLGEPQDPRERAAVAELFEGLGVTAAGATG